MARHLRAAVNHVKLQVCRQGQLPVDVDELAGKVGHQWRARELTPAVTVSIFLLQVLNGNAAMTALRHLSGVAVTASSFCEARARLPLTLFAELFDAVAQAAAAVTAPLQAPLQAPAPASATLLNGRRVVLGDGTARVPDAAPIAEKKRCFRRRPRLLLLPADRTADAARRRRRGAAAPASAGAVVEGLRRAMEQAGRATGVDERGGVAVAAGGADDPHHALHRAAQGIAHALRLRRHQLLDPLAYPPATITRLYGHRWNIETCFNQLKTHAKMNTLKSHSVAGVIKELIMYLIVWNLIRMTMARFAQAAGVSVWRVNFLDALRWLCALLRGPQPTTLDLLINPERPGRWEPRKLKRRIKPHDLLTEPRQNLKAKHRARYA